MGGAIRDALLGHPHSDWDLATSATPAEVREIFGARRTIPVGVEFGTVGVLDRDGTMHEVTTFRRDVKTDGRHAEVEFGVSLDDDLARRDFTINAIAYSPKTRELRDPFGGQRDLRAKLVRAVGNADARMREDRLRALRAIRFAARFDFSIEMHTAGAIAASAPFLGRLSPERVKQELDKTMEQVRCPSAALRIWKASGAFATLLPELARLPDDAFDVVDYLAMPRSPTRPARRASRYAGLLLRLTPEGAASILTGLRASKHETQAVVALIERWHKLGADIRQALMRDDPPTDVDVRRWIASIGRLQVGTFMRLASAVCHAEGASGRPAPSRARVHALHRRMTRSAFRDVVDLGGLAVDGDDLRRAGIRPGPGLGKILQTLLVEVLEDPARNTTDWLLQEAQRLHAALPPEAERQRGN